MLNKSHLKHTEVMFVYDEVGVYEAADSEAAIDLLEHEYVASINYIGICKNAKLFTAPANIKSTPEIIIDYYHFDSINPNAPQPPEHHLGSFKHNWETTDDWKTRCQHSIRIKYPRIVLLKMLYELGNAEVRKAMRDYVREADYFEPKKMESAEAIWFMSIILGSAEENE